MMPDMNDELLALVGVELRDEVGRCAAAAGYRLIQGDPQRCRRDWLRARAVIADPAAIAGLADAALPRRSGLLLVSDTEPPPAVWRRAIDLGAADAALLPADEERLVRTLSAIRMPRDHGGGAIAVMAAHGGAGASVLASAVALVAVDDGFGVLLLDVDDLGAGLDLTLGIEERPGLRWQDLSLEGGAVSGDALHHALPRASDRLSVLTGRRDDPAPLAADAVLATLDAGRAHGDLVIVDLPRADSPVVTGVVESVELVVLVTTPTVAGCAAARAVCDRLLSGADVELAVRGPAPGGLSADRIADAVGVPLIAGYRPDPRLPGRLESGRMSVSARSPLGRAALAIHRRVDHRRRVAA
ncbi:CpaE-like family protein [Gordonia sinesedis]